jgi:hypothetical protein
MKKIIIILVLFSSLLLLNSCLKPTVVNITLPGDKELNCEKLENALTDAQKFRNKAIKATGATVDNQLRGVFFWPALMVTYANAHEAIVAATERSMHLINIMQKKDCNNLNSILLEVQTTFRVQTLKELNETYKSLNELYKSGALSEKEFITHKKKILGQ